MKTKKGNLYNLAYSLGNSQGKDMYSKEAIDMLTSYLSEHPHDLVCIIAGYRDALQKCFFNYNQGLERRFPNRYEIGKYKPEELRLIFFKIIREYEWDVENEQDIRQDFFTRNID